MAPPASDAPDDLLAAPERPLRASRTPGVRHRPTGGVSRRPYAPGALWKQGAQIALTDRILGQAKASGNTVHLSGPDSMGTAESPADRSQKDRYCGRDSAVSAVTGLPQVASEGSEVFEPCTFYIRRGRTDSGAKPPRIGLWPSTTGGTVSVCEPMEGEKLKREALKLLNTQGYVVISDLGVAIGGDRLRAMYGVARQIRDLRCTVRDQKKQIRQP